MRPDRPMGQDFTGCPRQDSNLRTRLRRAKPVSPGPAARPSLCPATCGQSVGRGWSSTAGFGRSADFLRTPCGPDGLAKDRSELPLHLGPDLGPDAGIVIARDLDLGDGLDTPGRLMIITHGAGASHALIDHLDNLAARRGYQLACSAGSALTGLEKAALRLVPEQA